MYQLRTKLAAICFQVAAHDARVRDVENGEFGDALRVEEGEAPRYGSTPIMASEKDFLRAELIGDGENVGSEFGERVVSGATGLAAGVVAALVGNDDAKSGGGERLDLFVPGIPEFREAMEQDDHGAVCRTGRDGVEFDCAVVEGQVFKSDWHGAEFTLKCGESCIVQSDGPCQVKQASPYRV